MLHTDKLYSIGFLLLFLSPRGDAVFFFLIVVSPLVSFFSFIISFFLSLNQPIKEKGSNMIGNFFSSKE
jgi:hypothetical protein